MLQSMIDHEHLFRLIHEQEWADAAAVLQRHHGDLGSDSLLRQAGHHFVEGLRSALDLRASTPSADLLETLFLLHQGRFLHLPEELFQRVIQLLVTVNLARPEVAIAYARYYPEMHPCADVLREYGEPVRRRIDHEQHREIEVVASHSAARPAARPLLRSAQEEAFFAALSDAFPGHLVYPNVALSAVVDFEAVRERLGRRERHYFYRALIDFVVFEPEPGLWPKHFFELDSPLHDDSGRARNDRMKDRILGAAGQSLVRIRCRTTRGDRSRFRLLIDDTINRNHGQTDPNAEPVSVHEAPAEPVRRPT